MANCQKLSYGSKGRYLILKYCISNFTLVFIGLHILKYQAPEGDLDATVIALKMLPSRRLPWAKGTAFDPCFSDANQITIEIIIDDPKDASTYKMLVEWLGRNVNTGEAQSITFRE